MVFWVVECCTNSKLDSLVRQAYDAQDVLKDEHDIHVNLQRRENVFFRRDGVSVLASEHELSVKHEVKGENQGCQTAADQVEYLCVVENADEAHEQDYYQGDEQVGSCAGEVVFGLQRERGQGEADDGRYTYRH